MSEDEARQEAKDGATYLATLLEQGVPPETAALLTAKWVQAKLVGEVLRDALTPKKEPWEE